MHSDPKQCLYCTNNETLHDLMIEFAQLRVSRAFLFKEQTYRGRCLVAYKDHVNDLNELSDEDRNAFMADVAQVTRAMQRAFVSRAFLFKEQTYRGRCLVAYKDHVNDLNELSDEDRNAFMADVAQVTRAMQRAFNPEKINYGAYSDKLSHLHFHLAPKYVDGPDYGGTFQMNPGKVYLTDAEYQEMIDKIKACL